MGKINLAVFVVGLITMIVAMIMARSSSVDAVMTVFVVGLIIFLLGIVIFVLRRAGRIILK